MLVETTIRGETFTHKVLWECCVRQIETARRRKKGSKYFHISAMLLAYLTYESYINFLGDRFAPEIWAKEREFFNKSPYKGIEGKLKLLAERVPITGINKGRRPYQTIRELKSLRDFFSHGKVDRYEKVITHHRDEEPPLFGEYGAIDRLVSKEKAEQCLADVKEFVEFLHKEAAQQTDDIWFGEDPFEGIRGHSWGDSRVKA